MGETEPGPALASYRDSVTELIEAGKPFAVVGDPIDDSAGLKDDAKAALWPLACSMGDRVERRHDPRAHLDTVA